jgi:DNA invertase Pin-like site-specific DNA recombinase
MALVAQLEREATSRRIPEALAAARARGVELGCPNGAKHLRQYRNGLAGKALKAAAGERANGLAATIDAVKGEASRRFMKPLATRPVRSQRLRPLPSHPANERRSRCSSLI